jgi:hypothetical protein
METCLNFLNVRGNLRNFIECDGFDGFAKNYFWALSMPDLLINLEWGAEDFIFIVLIGLSISKRI